MERCRKILFIDDEPDILKLLEYVVRGLNLNCHFSVSGLEALKIIERDQPDLIFCDIRLPDVDGTKILECIRSNPNTEKSQVIAITAHAMPEDHDKYLSLGFDGYMSKPLNVSKLRQKLKSYADTGIFNLE